MKAQIIIIGDEILSGAIQDKNIRPLTQWLDTLGFELTEVIITRDREDLLVSTMKTAWESADLVISTGGLGPTKDDITKCALGILSGSQLKESEQAVALATKLYARRGRTWNRELNDYHLIPEKIEVFDNPKGFAPGLMLREERKLFLATPGVPRELYAMMEETLPALIKEQFPHLDERKKMITIRTHGVPEEKIFGELCPKLWEELEVYGKVSSLPQVMGVDIHIKLKNPAHYEKQRQEIIDTFNKSPLKNYIWCYENRPVAQIVIERAREKNLTIGFAESCTGGLVSHHITDISGASVVFMGGLVTYSNEAKKACLGVKEETLDKWGAVSEQTATQMAAGAKEKLQVDIALSLTGIAGPLGGSEEKPVGTVCIGVASEKENHAKRYHFFGDRTLLKERFAQAALFKALSVIDTF